MRVLGIVGYSGSGKTTLICRLLERLSDRRVVVVKRTHHEHPGLRGGKDTDRYLEAGADQSILVTPLAVHRFTSGGRSESALESMSAIVSRVSRTADLVIVESAMYEGDWPRLLVQLAARAFPDPFPPFVEAVVSDEKDLLMDGYPALHRDDLEGVARFVIRITA